MAPPQARLQSPTADESEQPLLSARLSLEDGSPDGRTAALEKAEQGDSASCGGFGLAGFGKEIFEQSKMVGPLALNLISNYSLNIVCLSFVGKLGDTQVMAAMALATTLSAMCGKIFLMGLCGAVDTLASQAAGAGQWEAMGVIFQRAVLFLLLHCIPVAALFMGVPWALGALGQPAHMCMLVRSYLLALLPTLFIDAAARPLNRILVAQRITQPQMVVGLVVAVQHVAACSFFIHTMGLGYLGAAAASAWSNLLSLLLLAAYLHLAGRGERVWGRPSREALSSWRQFGALAYASAAMKCVESLSFSLMNLLAGWLPGAAQSVAAISVAFNLYGILFMAFAAFGMAASTRVGNALGAGSAEGARLAALSSAVITPAVWLVVAFVLTWPTTQNALLGLFTTGADPVLLERMRSLLYLVVLLELFDGAQVVLSGIIAGVGKQKQGAKLNVLAYWACAVPVALLLGFHFKLGVEGLYGGMILGPAIQTVAYLTLILRLSWKHEALMAQQRAAEAAS